VEYCSFLRRLCSKLDRVVNLNIMDDIEYQFIVSEMLKIHPVIHIFYVYGCPYCAEVDSDALRLVSHMSSCVLNPFPRDSVDTPLPPPILGDDSLL